MRGVCERHAQDLQHFIGASVQPYVSCPMKAVGANDRVNLYPDSMLSCSTEFLNLEVLLEPLEKQLYLPAVLIKVGNLQCGQFRGIRQEHKLSLLLLIVEPHEPQMLRIAFLVAINSQFYLRISQYAFGYPPLPFGASVLQVGPGPDNEKRLRTMYAVQSMKLL